MTTGAPLYLVSACASADEFVAAFRRYADRSGLFVPIAEPLPAGRRGRIALALADGRIVLEGEAEITTSSPRPSPLYGRVGMTLKFVEPDEPTKRTLTELEKARLAMRPPPLSVAPRAGDVPAVPRPTPPPLGGRIDAVNALAECVAIGDLATWRDGAPKSASDTPSQRFVIPAIPQLGSPRPKTPSVPPALQPRIGAETKPPPLPGTTPIVIPPKVVTPATTMGMPPIDRAPVSSRSPADEPTSTGPELPVVSATVTKQGIEAPTAIPHGMQPIARPPAEPARPAAAIPRRDPTPDPRRGEAVAIPKREPIAIGKATTLGMPVVRLPAEPSEPGAPPPTPAASTGTAAPRRAHSPSTPPAPRHPTPYAPLPIVRKPASELLTSTLELSEPTERTAIPEPPLVGGDQRKTSLGVAIMTASPVESGWDESEPAYVGPPPQAEPEPADSALPTEQQDAVGDPGDAAPAAATRSGGLRASEIMAAIQGEDWTMTPDAAAPTVLSSSMRAANAPPSGGDDLDTRAAAEKSGPAAGDWAISLDPAAPGGWSAPAKVEKLPEPKPQPASGNRNIAVASAKPLDAVEWEEKPTGIGEPLVQIDPSLMDTGAPLPAEDDPAYDDEPIRIVSVPIGDVAPPRPPAPAGGVSLPLAAGAPTPPSLPPTMPLPLPPPPLPGLGPPPLPPRVPEASAPHPALPAQRDIFRDSASVSSFTADPTASIVAPRSRRRLAIILGAAALAAIVTVVLIVLAGGKPAAATHEPTAHAAAGSGSSTALGSGSGPVAEHIAEPNAGSGSAEVEVPAPALDAGLPADRPPTVCTVKVTTNPSGAEIALDKSSVVGTSPATITLPCGVATKLYIRKARYGSTVRTVTASAEGDKLAVRIPAPTFQIKVTSSPSGATITIGHRVVGITPTSVRVAAFATTRIMVSKDGYVTDIEKIAPRQNNAAHHVTLRRATRRR